MSTKTLVRYSQRGSCLMYGLWVTAVWGLRHQGNLIVSWAEAAPLPGTTKTLHYRAYTGKARITSHMRDGGSDLKDDRGKRGETAANKWDCVRHVYE